MKKRFWLILYTCLVVILLQNTLSAQENIALSLTLQDQLLVDQDGDGLADPGDTIRYTASVTNCGTDAAENVQMNASLDPNTSLNPGSVQVNAPQSSSNCTNTDTGSSGTSNPTPVDPSVPSVTATTPANTSTEIALAANVSVTFSEAVTTTGDWFQMVCTVSGTFNPSSGNVTITGGPTSFTLDPNVDLQVGESCTVTIAAAQVNAQDNNAAMAANHVFSFTTETPPTITATTPANGATAVSNNNDIIVTFDEPVNISAASFTLECPAGTPFAGGFAVAGSGTNTITINPTGSLPSGTTCQVVAIAANISDVDANDPPDLLDGNSDNVEGDDYTFSFTTDVDAAPAVQAISPANGAVSVATNTTITVTFDEPVDIASAAAFSLECPVGTPIGFTVTTPAILPASTTTVIVTPAGLLPDATTCTFTVVASQVTDTDTNDPPNNMAADFTSTFTTEAPPSITGTTPTNAATGVATNSNIVINFNEPVTVTNASFTVECPVGTPIAFTVSGSGTNTITLDPTGNFPATSTCGVTVLAAQVSDLDVIDPPDTMAADYSFTFDVIVDAAPTVNQPAIVPASTSTGANSATLNNPVSTTPTITIPFSEPVDAATGAFELACNAVPIGVTTTPALPSTNQSALNITSGTPLAEGANCVLTVVSANIADSDTDDPPNVMVTNYTLTFTVDTAPAETLTETEVGNVFQDVTGAGATNVDLDSNIQITFNEPVNMTVPANALQCPAGNNIATTVTGNGTATLTLNPNVNLPLNTLCVLNIPAANIADVDTADAPDNTIAAVNHTFQTVDDDAPTVTTNPANGGGNIAVNSNITVTFNEAVTLTGGWFGLSCSVSGNRVSTGELTGTGITIIENTPDLVYTIDPTVDLAAGDICTITLVSANVVDNDLIDPPNELDGDASSDILDGDADDYVAVFSTQDMPPQINSTTPVAAAATSANQVVTLNFSELVNIAAGAFTFECPAGSPIVGGFTTSAPLPATGLTTISLTPNNPLPFGAACRVTIESTLVTDIDPIDPPNQLDGDTSGDLIDGDADDFVLDFTVDAQPAVTQTETEVTNVFQNVTGVGASNVDLDSNIRVTFSEAVNATGTSFSLACPVGNPVAFTLAGSGTTVVTVDPTPILPANTACEFNIIAANIADVDTLDAPDTLASNISYTFNTINENPPAVSAAQVEVANTLTALPLGAGVYADADTNLQLTFSEAVTLTGNWAELNCTISGVQDVTLGLVVTDADPVYTLNPATNLTAGENCTLTVFAAQVADDDAIDPPNTMVANAVYNFSVQDVPPQVNTATSIPPNGATVSNNQTVTLNFTEMVDIAAGAIAWVCDAAPITFTPALPQNNVTTVMLTPSTTLTSAASCTVTLESTLITDDDTVDGPNELDGNANNDLNNGDADDFILTFTVDEPPAPISVSVDVGGVPQFLPLLGGQTADVGTDIRVVFTEPVDATAAGMTLECPVGNAIAFTGLPAANTANITLNPTANLPAGTLCRLVLVHTGIGDTDLIDPPNLLDGNGNGVEGDSVFITFTTQAAAVDDAYTVTPHLTYVSPTGVRANDTPTTATITGFGATLGTANGTVPNGTNFITASGAGGRVVMNADGTFTFYPDAGDDNTDGTVTFFYTIAGGDTAQVTLTFEAEEFVWFVDGGGGCIVGTGTNVGTQACPATDMVTTVAASQTANDIIFVDSGPYQCGITLQNDVMVIGNGSSSTLTALAASRVTPVAGSNFAPYDALNGADPTLNSAASDCITLGQNNTLRGFTIANTGNFAGIVGTNYGTLTITELTDNGTGQMIVLNTGTVNATFDALISSASDATFPPIRVMGSTITAFNVLGGTSIANPESTGIFLANNIGAGGFSFGNTTISRPTATAGAGIILGNGAAQANPVTFLSLGINNSSGSGLVGNEQQGAITVVNNTGSISTSGGAAIDIARAAGNTPINLNFNQITTVNSPTYGIRLDNVTGPGVSVSGNISLDLTAATAGILLENITAGAYNFAVVGTVDVFDRQNEGIFLNNVGGGSVAFGNTTINNLTGATEAAIRGQNGTSSVTFAQVNINQGNNGTGEAYVGGAGTAPAATTGDGDAVYFTAMTGGITINGGTVQNAADDGFDIRASSNVTINGVTVVGRGTAGGATSQGIQIYNGGGTYQLDNLTLRDVQGGSTNSAVYVITDVNNTLTLDIDNGTWTGNSAPGNNSTSGYGLFASSSNGTIIVDIDNTNFTDISTMGVFVRGENTANLTTRIQNADFNGTGVNGNNGVWVNSTAAHTGSYQFQIANNTFTDAVILGRAIAATFAGTTNAAFLNLITGNTISQTAPGTSTGIILQVTGNADLNANVDDNSITNLSDNGIEVIGAAAWTTGHTLNINLRNNTVGTMAQPVGQSGASLRNSAIFVRNQGAGTANIYVDDPAPATTVVSVLASNGNDRGTVFISNQSTGAVNATVRGLIITNTGGDQNTFYGENTGAGTTCLDIENTAANGGAGEFDIRQTAGTLNMRFVGNLGTVNTTGTIGATGGCTLPVVVMASPMFVEAPTFGAETVMANNEDLAFPLNVLDAILNSGVNVANAQTPSTVTIPFGTIPANSTVSATFDVVVGENIPDNINFLTIQGTLSGLNILSNDPDTQQNNDPTNTPLDPLRNVRQLPSTGETPWWQSWLIVLFGLGVLSALTGMGRHLRMKRAQ